MSEENGKEKITRKVMNLDRLIEAHEDGIWRDLPGGGRLKMLYQPFEQGQKLVRLQQEYRTANDLPPDAPIPPEVGNQHQEALLRGSVTDFDGSSFVLDGKPVEDRDASGNLHEANLDRIMATLCLIPDTRGACFVLLNTIGADITKAQEAEEKNSSAPSPIS